MSAQQPRAYNYVATQDFSANTSASQGGGSAPQSQYQPPINYQQEQQNYSSENDTYRPSTGPQSYYPPSAPLPQGQQTQPPPVNFQSHPQPGQGVPGVHAETKPHPQQQYQQQYQQPQTQYQATPYGDPSQQGQVSFDEKFRPPSDKPKWNDVAYTVIWLTFPGLGWYSLLGSLHRFC